MEVYKSKELCAGSEFLAPNHSSGPKVPSRLRIEGWLIVSLARGPARAPQEAILYNRADGLDVGEQC